MKNRKLRAAVTVAAVRTVVHDRRTTDLPFNAVVGEQSVKDPTGDETIVSVSLRDDPLNRLRIRGWIDDAQFHGGRAWQRCYEATQLWPSSELKDPVDGGGQVADPYVRIADASAMIRKCTARLGDTGDALIRAVLADRLFLAQIANTQGMDSRDGSRDMAYLGRRLRECLNTLAKVFGYA